MEPPITPAPEEPRKNNTVLYIVIGVVLLCCCCATLAGAYWLWNNGDRLLQGVGTIMRSLG
jgi:hypothetical protein